jgi:hypothetical protein
LSASVNLRGLTVVISRSLPEFQDGVGEQSENDREDRPGDRQNKDRKAKDRISGS